jgi:hypothetical protein
MGSFGGGAHAQAGCVQGSDGSLTCACSKASVDQGQCCHTNPHPACSLDCAVCTSSNWDTCCDPMIRGYLCTCAGPKTTTHGQLSYYLLTVTYVPPGNASTEQYLGGTTIGSQVQVQVTNAGGGAAQITTPAGQLSASYLYGGIDGHAFQVTTNKSWGPQQTSILDLADHVHDSFWLWTNVDATMTVQDNQYTASLQPPPGEAINIISVTAAELVGLEPVAGYKAEVLGKMSTADKRAILRVDPFISHFDGETVATPTLDSKRFASLNWHFQVTGPDSATDPPTGVAFDTNNQTVEGTIFGYLHQATGSLLFGGNVSFLTGASAYYGAQYQYTYQKTTQSNTGSISDAQGLLSSKTPCWHQGVDVYWDGAFGTFLFLPTDQGSADCNDDPDLAGLVTTQALSGGASRQPASVVVTATTPDGAVWRTQSNVHGAFRFFHLPENAARGIRIATEGTTNSVDITRFVGLSSAFQVTRSSGGDLVVSLPQPDCSITRKCVTYENGPPTYFLTCNTAADVYSSFGLPVNGRLPALGELLGQKVTTQSALTTEYEYSVAACAPGTRDQCTRFSIQVAVASWCHSPPPPPPKCPECRSLRCCENPTDETKHLCVALTATCPPLR